MHYLLFLAGTSPRCREEFLDRTAHVFLSTIPPPPTPLTFDTTWLPDAGCGWLAVKPEHPSLRGRVGSHVSDDIAVVLYGEVSGDREGTGSAARVAAAWRSGGIAAVRDLDGCFSALIVERRSGRCVVLSDIIGRRTLRYLQADGLTLFATHDVLLAATGLLNPAFDLSAVASAAAFGWSLGGTPLLSGVRTCQPDEYVSFDRSGIVCHPDRRLKADGRISERDSSAVGSQLDAMVEHLRHVTAEFCGSAPCVKTDLTAGLDSRCVLALVLGAVERSRIVTGTNGPLNSRDVVVARRIAGRHGLTHEVLVHDEPQPDHFREHLRVLAFSLNGDTDGKRALTDIYRGAEFVDATPRLYGLASEIYRGYYYPPASRSRLLTMPRQQIVAHLRRRTSLIDQLPWKDSGTGELLGTMLERRLDQYAPMAGGPVDLLDLFYVFERFSRWGALSARATWWSQYFAPFSSTRLLTMAFRLPAPIGFGVPLQRAVLRRLLPGSYTFPLINGTVFPPSLRYPAVALKLGRAAGLARRLSDGVATRLGGSRGPDTMDDWSARHLGDTIRATVEDILSKPGGLGTRILREEGIRELVDGFVRGNPVSAALGSLLTAEVWREQVQRTCEEAGRGQ